MLILGLDTATTTASVALVEGEELVAEGILNIPLKTHSQKLLPVLARLLRGAGLEMEDVDAFAVSAGPGSFTGLRIGLATGKGFAQALSKPLITVPTLDALAYNYYFPGALICPLLDAKQGLLYTALYRGEAAGPQRQTDYLALPAAKVAQHLLAQEGLVILLGDGIELLGKGILAQLGKRAFVVPAASRLPRASSVAFLGLQALEDNPRGDPLAVEPLYVRRSAAELNLEKRRARREGCR